MRQLETLIVWKVCFRKVHYIFNEKEENNILFGNQSFFEYQLYCCDLNIIRFRNSWSFACQEDSATILR